MMDTMMEDQRAMILSGATREIPQAAQHSSTSPCAAALNSAVVMDAPPIELFCAVSLLLVCFYQSVQTIIIALVLATKSKCRSSTCIECPGKFKLNSALLHTPSSHSQTGQSERHIHYSEQCGPAVRCCNGSKITMVQESWFLFATIFSSQLIKGIASDAASWRYSSPIS